MLKPPPQDLSHFVQAAHSVSSQSTGHGLVLQSTVSTVEPHGLPSPKGRCKIGRVRVCFPPEQLASQAVNADQSPMTQSSTHDRIWQA